MVSPSVIEVQATLSRAAKRAGKDRFTEAVLQRYSECSQESN